MRNGIQHVAALLAMAFASSAMAEEIACLEIGTRADVRQLAYSPDGSMLVSVSGSDLSVWDVKKKERLWNGGFAARVLEMPTFVAKRPRLLVATYNVKDKDAFYDVRGFTFTTQGETVRITHDDEVPFTFPWPEQPIAISERSVITKSWKGEPWLDPKTGIMRPMHYRDRVFKFYALGQDEPGIFTADSYCAVSGVFADQRWIVLDLEKPRELAILDAVTRTIIRRLKAPTETIVQALVTHDKRTLISAPSVPGNEVYFWDLMSGDLKIVRVRLADVMALSSDNRILAAAGHNCVDVLDVKTKEVLGRETYPGGSCVSIQFAPDGASYAIGEQRGRVRIFSTPKRGE